MCGTEQCAKGLITQSRVNTIGMTSRVMINYSVAGDPAMVKANIHGQMIARAAKAALLPLGCRRKGKSRVWYADQRYWAIWIEFQPSGWSKGNYLNIGVMWLWRPKPSVAFSYRPADFAPFETEEQFAPLIARMAVLAAQEVHTLRGKLSSFASVLDFIKSRATLRQLADL